MRLFEEEVINISKIVTVNMYETKKSSPVIHYNANLSTYELVFFVSSECDTYFGNNLIKDRINSIRYLPKGISHSEYRIENTKPGYCIDIFFDTDSPMPEDAIGFENMDILRDKFIKIYNIWFEKKPGYYITSMKLFYDIIETFSKHQKKYITSACEHYLNQAYDYLLKNYRNKNFDYSELCKHSGLKSYSYFKEIFISKYNMPPVKYVTQMRINYAKELLATGRYSITEIAEMCGFENVYYFSTVFKKQVGLSPKNFMQV